MTLIKQEDAIEAVAQQWLLEASAESPYVNDDDIGEYRKLAEELFEDVPSADAVPHDAINEMDRDIIKDILKMMPTAYLLEALGVSTFEELTEPTDRPHGEWIDGKWCSICGCGIPTDVWGGGLSEEEAHYCVNCGAKMGGDNE